MKNHQVNVPFEWARLCLIRSHPLHAQHQRINLPFPSETLTSIAPNTPPIASFDSSPPLSLPLVERLNHSR